MYRRLVEKLRSYAEQYRSGKTLGRAVVGTENIMDAAADALEQLQAEHESYIYRTSDAYCAIHGTGIDVREYCVEGPCEGEEVRDNGES